ncbi:PilN domain-containing protein [Luminiphilus sp.]|nr:PilN domain-containing protein [Luminiphilus sp.]
MAGKNQFEVFGVDVRDYGQLWLAAWRDFLFGDDSPIRTALDSKVILKHADGTSACYQAGRQVTDASASAEAYAISDDLVLSRTLTLPSIAEADLEAALHLEVSACSPFNHDDTASGWRISRGENRHILTVDLVIASRTAVMGFLGKHFNVIDPSAPEVWGSTGAHWVRLNGFGEMARESDYRRRLVRSGALVTVCFALILSLAGLSVIFAERELAGLEALQDETARAAQGAIASRDELAATNVAIGELNKLRKLLPSPQAELFRLTQLLPDSAYVTQLTQEGRSIRLRGRGADAASLQQAMTQEPAFNQVTAPQAISKVGNTGLEQFFLDIKLKAVP